MKARPEPSTVPASTQARLLGGWACSAIRATTPRSQGGWTTWAITASRLGGPAVQLERHAVRLGDEELADAAVGRLARRVGETAGVQAPARVLEVIDREGEVIEAGAA